MIKDTTGLHPRAHRFGGTDSEKKDDASLYVILFNDDTKLRSHTVKHFCNLFEQSDWKKLLKIQNESISGGIDALRDLGCPHMHARTQNPPCSTRDTKCHLFDRCGKLVSPLEKAFLDGCRQVIQNGLDLPRNVRYQGDNQRIFMWFLPNVPVVAKLEWMHECYNLSTCYRPMAEVSSSWKQVCDRILNEVHIQSVGSPQWNTEATWGILPFVEKPAKGGGRKNSPREQLRKKDPYRRETSDWRSYLDDLDS